MISICQLYIDFKGANNTWANGHFRPKSFIYAVHESQIEIFNELRKAWENNNIVDDNLRNFFKTVQVPLKKLKKNGLIEYPKDYSTFSSLGLYSKKDNGAGVLCADLEILDVEEKSCRPLREEDKEEETAMNSDQLIERDIRKVPNGKWRAAVSHEFIVPSIEDPICTQYNTGFKVLPKELGYVVLDYLALPERPILNIVRKGNDFICGEGCTNLLWGEEILPELMSRIKTKYASYTSNQQKYIEGVKETQIVGS